MFDLGVNSILHLGVRFLMLVLRHVFSCSLDSALALASVSCGVALVASISFQRRYK